MRKVLLFLGLLACLAVPPALPAQDTVPLDTAIVLPIPDPPIDTTVVDTVVAPPSGLPTPTVPGFWGIVQGVINEYALAIVMALSSLIMMWLVRKFPGLSQTQYGEKVKHVVLFLVGLAVYTIIVKLGGTAPQGIIDLLAGGLLPSLVAVAGTSGIYKIGQKQKSIVAEARQYASLQGRT